MRLYSTGMIRCLEVLTFPDPFCPRMILRRGLALNTTSLYVRKLCISTRIMLCDDTAMALEPS